MTSEDDLLDLSTRELLERVAAREPAPAAGSVAAVVLGLACALTAMAARFSEEHWEGAIRTAELAEALRLRSAPLVQADAEAYSRVLDALRAPKGTDTAARDEAITSALAEAAGIPLEIAQIGVEVAELAAELAEHGNTNLRGDAAAGAVLAEASVRVAATLVAINLAARPDDGRISRSAALASAAAAAAGRAVSTAA